MPAPAPNANDALYRRRSAAHRRGLVQHWTLVFVALGVAIALGLISPDRSLPPTPNAVPASIK